MKTIMLFFIMIAVMCMINQYTSAQNVGINDDGSQPDASAMLDIKSSDKGVLVPRLELNDINSASPITDPEVGLLVYANTLSAIEEGFYFWNGSKWVKLVSGEGIPDNDSDPENELQTISKTGSTVTLSDGGGSFTDEVEDSDSDPTNEIQTLTKSGNTISLSGGGSVTDNVDDADADNSNEIQNLQEVLIQGNDAGSNKISNLADPTLAQDAATKNYVDINSTSSPQNLSNSKTGNDITVNISDGTGTTFSIVDDDSNSTNEIQNLQEVLSEGNSAGNVKITNLSDPTLAQDAATKNYVDNSSGVPSGVILMWSGNLTAIPTGWAICDGTNGTPDLRDRFICSVGTSENPGATGGSNTYTLSTSQLPSHTHSFTTNSAGSHTHSFTTNSAGNHSHDLGYEIGGASGSNDLTIVNWSVRDYEISGGTSTDGSHSHSGTTNSNGSHSHSGTTDATGSSSSIDNRPNYFKLAFIMKL